jgi:4-hydroxybenzoate polyprenyltransferase
MAGAAEIAARAPGLTWARLRQYLAERFPLPVTLLLSVATVAAAWAAAQERALAAGAPLRLDAGALAGVGMVLLFLFHLRVFDEHKDFAVDAATRPDRPVQRGLITLAQLRALGAAAIAGELVLAATGGVRPALVYALPLGWSVLMYFEFFARQWLAARIFLYALTHSLVMSLLALAVAVRLGFELPPALAGALALALTSTLAIDVLRKSWAPENEVAGLDSYTRRLGARGAALLGAATVLASAALAGWIGWRLGGRTGWLATDAVITAWGVGTIAGFGRAPTARRQKQLELVAGMHMLVLFIGLAVLAGVVHGVEVVTP